MSSYWFKTYQNTSLTPQPSLNLKINSWLWWGLWPTNINVRQSYTPNAEKGLCGLWRASANDKIIRTDQNPQKRIAGDVRTARGLLWHLRETRKYILCSHSFGILIGRRWDWDGAAAAQPRTWGDVNGTLAVWFAEILLLWQRKAIRGKQRGSEMIPFPWAWMRPAV